MADMNMPRHMMTLSITENMLAAQNVILHTLKREEKIGKMGGDQIKQH